MRHVVGAVFLVATVVVLVAVSFTFSQVDQEEKRMRSDIQYRSTLVAESLRETVEPNFVQKSDTYLQRVVERFSDEDRFAGLAVYDNKSATVAASPAFPLESAASHELATDVMDEDKAHGDFVRLKDTTYYVFAVPLHDQSRVVGSLAVAQYAGYIDTRIGDIWRNNLYRLTTQIFFVSVAIVLVLRWLVYEPAKQLIELLRLVRSGADTATLVQNIKTPILRPILREVATIQKNLLDARFRASEEARLRFEKLDSPWTADRLKAFIEEGMRGRTLFVVSNREPYIHTKRGSQVTYYFPASGMATAIEPIMQACGGVWIAHGSGDADRLVVDARDKIAVPPDEPKYTLRRVWMSDKEEAGYYYGFANEGLWPLCHHAHTRPVFRKEDWEMYRTVNGIFAKAVLEEIAGAHRPMVLVQDFHFAILPRIIKKARPDAVVGLFWHVPWPSAEAFSICPYRKELIDGMLGADLVGFHTQLHCNNFIDTVGKELEARIDLERFSVTRGEHVTHVKPFPISIAFSNTKGGVPEVTAAEGAAILKELGVGTKLVGIGVDRLDYTKGIVERMKAIEYFLDTNPSFCGEFTFVQIAAPSRSKIAHYQEFARQVEHEVARINKKFRSRDWRPIVFLPTHHDHRDIYALYKAATFCLVTSLHDGMNLVAKEFVAARDDEQGVLILSQFAGASRELTDALIVNPYHTEQVAEAIKTAATMLRTEQKRRMKRLRAVVAENNVYRWSADLIKTLVNIA